jgi:hypothetical protein
MKDAPRDQLTVDVRYPHMCQLINPAPDYTAREEDDDMGDARG